MESINLKRGLFFVLLSSFCFSLMGMLVRAAGDIPFIQKTLFRNLIAFFFALAMLLKKGIKNPSVFTVQKPAIKFLIMRAIFGSVGIFGNFYAIDHLPISDAAMLNKMSPFFALLISFFVLGEKPSKVSVASIFIAFCGTLFVIKPSFDFNATLPALVGFAGGMGAGVAYACIRKCHTYNVEGFFIIAFFSAFSLLCAIPWTILNFTPMTIKQLLLLLGAGLAAALGQLGVTGAYFNAPANKISVYEYTQIPFSAALGFIAFAQLPDAFSILGYVIIIGTAIAVFIYNNKKLK